MKLRIFQVDAFADEVFQGNPAAVCPLDEWLPDNLLQNIAMENNLSETAYFVGKDGSYELRWFTPSAEVDLCGHATLASAWVLHNELGERADPVSFSTRSGELLVSGDGDTFTLDFPLVAPVPCFPPDLLIQALDVEPVEILTAADFLILVKDEQTVRDLAPDFARLKGLPNRGIIVTAPGEDVDFVSRWFGPNVGVNEDPVTGSAHTTLAPYWAARLGKDELLARQISPRGGSLLCRIVGERVHITGSAKKYMEGEIFLQL